MGFPKAFRLLLSLKDDECRRFKDYLQSPYFNKNDFLLQLCNHILNDFNDDKKTYCQEEFVQKAYGKLDKFTFRNYNSHLQKLCKHFERFVVVENIEQDEQQRNQIILKDFLQRNSGDFFKSKYKQTLNQLDKSPMNIYYYQNKYQIEWLLDSYIKLYKDKITGDANLQAVSNAIDQDFVLKKLCTLVLMHNRENITNASYDFGFEPYLLDYLSSKPVIEYPLINLLYKAFEILTGSDKKAAFENLNEQLRQNDQEIAKDMMNGLYVILQNNFNRLTTQKAQMHQQLFDLYNILLSERYIQTQGKLSIYFFKNVVSIGLELEKYDFVKNVMAQYKNKLLPEDTAENAHAYSKAKYLLYIGNSKEAHPLIINLHFTDTIYKFDLRCLELMLYYDLKEFILLEARINAFEVALSPNHSPYISEKNTKTCRNFISCIKKMYRFCNNPNRSISDIQNLIAWIKDTNQIPNRRWVLMKAETLLLEFDN